MPTRAADGMTLAAVPALVVDAQATAAHPRGALLEIGWAAWPAADAGAQASDQVRATTHPAGPVAATALVVAAPPAATLPHAVSRITGLRPADWARGVPECLAWHRLEAAAAALSPAPVPALVHFARFEEPLLRALHARHGSGPFPFRFVCTHAIARRLLPQLPRRTLRALAGYFGAGVGPLRRSAEHVSATAFVWRHLAALLEERGIRDIAGLEAWLCRPAPRSERAWPLARETRLSLPAGPGVYRLLRAGGSVVYVGKASSLRQRVSGHLHARGGERALEMLTQVRDVSFTETATALEAALLEADEIKRLAPPYNVALTAAERTLHYATPDLLHLQEAPDERHPVGPLPSRAPFDALAALRALLADPRAGALPLRARALGVPPQWAPDAPEFEAGLGRFVGAHGAPRETREVLRLGARLWSARLQEEALAEPEDDEPTRRPAWDAEHVCHGLEETVLRAAHAVRRARWLTRLSECALAWGPAEGPKRLLVMERGALVARGFLGNGEPVGVPPGHARDMAARRVAFDVATFDRLRVLTTELRSLAAGKGALELRLGTHARLSPARLRAVLRSV
jgi:DNA polymerase-3 subunit epsilon